MINSKWVRNPWDKKTALKQIFPKDFERLLKHTEKSKDIEIKKGDSGSSKAFTSENEQGKFVTNGPVQIRKSKFLNKLQMPGNETISTVAISRDGRKIAFGSLKKAGDKGHMISFVWVHDPDQLLDASAGYNETKENDEAFLRINDYHPDLINSISFDLKSKEVAVCDNKGNICLYSTETLETFGDKLGTITLGFALHRISYTNEKESMDRYLACGSTDKVFVYKLEERSFGVAEEAWVQVESDGEEKEQTSAKFEGNFYVTQLLQIARKGRVLGLALMPDFRSQVNKSGMLVCVGGTDQNLTIYCVRTGADTRKSFQDTRIFHRERPESEKPGDEVFHLDLPKRVETLSVSDTGEVIAFGGETYVTVLEHKIFTVYHDGHDMHGFKAHRHMLTPFCFKKKERTDDSTEFSDWEESVMLNTEYEVVSVSLSCDGKRLCVGSSDKTAKMYDVESAAQIHEFQRSARVSEVALDEKGEFALVGAFDAQAIRYYVGGGLSPSCIIEDKKDIQSVDISGDGKRLMTCSIGKVKVFDLKNGLEKVVFDRLKEAEDGSKAPVVVYCGELTYYGDYCFAGGYDNLVIMYDVEEQSEIFKIQFGFFIWGLSIRHILDAKAQVAHSNKPIPTKDIKGGEPLQLAIGSWDKTAKVYEVKYDRRSNKFDYEEKTNFTHGDRVFSVSLSGDGNLLAVGTRDCKAVVYDIRKPPKDQMIVEWTRPERVYCVCISHSADMLAVGDVEKVLTVFDMKTRKDRNSWQRGGIIHDVEFSPDDKILAAGGEDNKVVLYDLEKDTILLQVPLGGVCWDLGICMRTGAFICAEGNKAVVYGEAQHGYGMQDRPSFAMANQFLNDLDSMRVTLNSHPTLLNAVDGISKKSLLQLAVEENYVAAAKIILSGDIKKALLEDNEGHTALTKAILGKRKQMLQLILEGIINKHVVDSPASLRCLYKYTTEYTTEVEKPDDTPVLTLFEELGKNFPDILLKFMEDYKEQPCEPSIMGNLTQAPIKHSICVGLPRRSPRNFWEKFVELEKEGQKYRYQNKKKNKSDIELAVEPFRIPIEGLLQKFPAPPEEGSSKKGMYVNSSPLEVIVEATAQMKDYSVFKDHTIATRMINYKWATIKRHFLFQFVVFFVYLFMVCLLSNATANMSEAFLGVNLKISELWSNDYDNTWGKVGLITVGPVALFAMHYTYQEFRQFKHEAMEIGVRSFAINMYYMATGYFKSYWNFIDFVMYPLQLTGCICFLARATGAREVVAISTLLAFIKLLFFCRFWDAFGPLVRMIYRTIKGMMAFLIVIVVLLFGFGMVFKVLEIDNDEFRTYPRAVIQTSLLMYGEFDALGDHLEEPGQHWLTVAMFELNLLLIVIILLNLLIAIMNDVYTQVNTNATLEYRLELANIILEAEKGVAFSRTDARLYPKWVHILRPIITLDPDEKTEWQYSIEMLLKKGDANEKRHQTIEQSLRETTSELHRMKVSLDESLRETNTELRRMRVMLDKSLNN